EAVSAPAKFVSGGKVLVRVRAEPGPFTVWLNGRDVSEAFVGGSGDVGLISGLKLGTNRIELDQGRKRTSIKVINHALEGPMVSGPHMSPFVCQTQDFKLPDGSTLGPPLDKDCFAATRVQYLYKAKGASGLKLLTKPELMPADAEMVTTLSGVTVPFVVRVETGVINRAIYQFAVLHNPATDGAIGPRNSPKGWARRLIAVHGTGCARGWYIQGAAMGVNPVEPARLAQGFAIFTSTLNHPTNSCNPILAGETTVMVRQHVIETLGAPIYTLTMGGSGGAYTSLQIADEFPGLFDGVLTSATFPDALAISLQSSDGRLLNHYFREVAPGAFTPEQQQAIGGYGAPIGLLANGNQTGRTDPVPARKDADNYLSAVWNQAVPQTLRYDPKTNPNGARPTVFDWGANVYGRDRKTGFARRPFDNTGVQYGLKALNDGVITKAQFIALNRRIGGYDADTNYVASRSVGDDIAIRNAYRSGMMLSGAGGLKDLPMLDFSGIYSDLRPSGDYHMKHHHFSVRERLKRWNGRADNMVMWSDGGRAERGTAAAGNTAEEAFAMMDRWLTAVADDDRPGTRLEKTLRDKPQGLTDGCFDAAHRFIAEAQVPDNSTTCNKLYPVHSFPRGVAGGPLSTDVIKCRLKALDRRDYKVAFDDKEWAELKRAFPNGVCDWSKVGLGQQPVRPWSIW
ncbi:MAG TPA: DUF6351 family protein, partial [Caulobacteraceae bacterium]|nr:DUF6351 family protein [Caulobacteraceae bacterium]